MRGESVVQGQWSASCCTVGAVNHRVDCNRGEGEPEQPVELRGLELRALARDLSEGDRRGEVAHAEGE